MRLLGDPDGAIRQSVIAALNSIGHPEMRHRIGPLLSDPDPAIRESAAKIAGYFGYSTCLDGVLACCRDASETVRRTAVEQLPFFDDSRVGDLLLRLLDDEMASVRTAAATALARVDHPARIEALVRALGDADAWVRYVTVKSLAAIGAVEAVTAVVGRLQDDPAPHVRSAAIEAIGRLKPPQALEILQPLTHSVNEDIARAAIVALGHVDHADALALVEQESRGPAPWRRFAAIEALTNRREKQVAETLQWIAAADQDAAVAAAAVDVLARIGLREEGQGTEALRALMMLATEPSRREAAIAALSSMPARRSGDVAAGLRHPSAVVRCAVVEALGRMKQPDATRAIEAALDDASAPVRLTAVAELKYLGSRSAQRRLMALARTDSDAGVRHAAMMAMIRAANPGEPDAVGSR